MIIDLQRRIAEVGRIRIGQTVEASNGKKRPAKLSTFRLTSSNRRRIEQAAHLYGGEIEQWDAPAGPQWEVITQSDQLSVIVPPSDMAFSQHYELWSGGGCQRRCDGQRETIREQPCVCDPDRRDCDIHTRLSVMLRDLPGLGVWRLDTQGYYAAVELQGAVGVIQMAAAKGAMLPAQLRLEQRMAKRGNQTRRYAVPVLDVEISPTQLVSGVRPAMLDPATPRPEPLVDGSRSLERAAPRQLDEAPTRMATPEQCTECGAPSDVDCGHGKPAPPRRRSRTDVEDERYDREADATPADEPPPPVAPAAAVAGVAQGGSDQSPRVAAALAAAQAKVAAQKERKRHPADEPQKGNLTPVPQTVDEHPAPPIADQLTNREPKRKSRTPPVVSTGITPRTTAQAAEQAAESGLTVTTAQLQKLAILRTENGYSDSAEDRADWFAYVESLIGRPVTTNKELTKVDAMRIIDALEMPAPTDEDAPAPEDY